MKHTLRGHVSGRFQCTLCRAAFLTKESARRSAESCAEYERCHGHRYEREHVLYPFSYTRGDGHGPDRLCDEANCGVCVGHDCDCDVCGERLIAKDLCSVIENLDRKTHSLSPNWTEIDIMANLLELVNGIAVGASVEAIGVDTRGHSVTRTGVLLAEPKKVKAQRNGTPTPAVRVSVGTPGEEATARSTWVTIFADSGSVELAEVRDEWRNEPLGNVPGVRSGNHNIRIMFGGKGGKRSAEPTMSVRAGITYTGEGKYEVWSAETGDVLHTCALAGQVWWKPAPLEEAPEVQSFPSTKEGYELVTDGKVPDGDVLLVESEEVVGFTYKDTWPMAVTAERGKFVPFERSPFDVEGGRYASSAEAASGLARDLGYPLAWPEEKPRAVLDPTKLEWKDTELRDAVSSLVIVYGGRGGEGSTGPSQAQKVRLGWTDGGVYTLCDLETNELVDTLSPQSWIWWASMPAEHYEDQAQPKARPAYLEPDPVKMIGRVPENTLYMAENANTAAARAWWQRRVESYSQPVTV